MKRKTVTDKLLVETIEKYSREHRGVNASVDSPNILDYIAVTTGASMPTVLRAVERAANRNLIGYLPTMQTVWIKKAN